jgi:hypothetical protein
MYVGAYQCNFEHAHRKRNSDYVRDRERTIMMLINYLAIIIVNSSNVMI